MNSKIDSSLYRSSAKADYNSSNHASAYLKCTKALKAKPNDHRALHKILVLLFHQQKYKQAEIKVRRLLILRPMDSRVYLNQGFVLSVLEKYKEAEIAYEQCIKYDKTLRFPTIGRNLAIVLMKQGKYKEALDVCKRAIKLVGQDEILYNSTGYIHFLQGEYDKALENFEMGIECASEGSTVYLNKTIVLWVLEKKEEARLNLEIVKGIMKTGRVNLKKEIGVYSKEKERLKKQEWRNEDLEGVKRIQGIQFILDFLEEIERNGLL